MRELEFLPDWYPRMRRRKRWVAFQTWLLLALLAGLGMWVGLARSNVRAAEANLGLLQGQLDAVHARQHILSEKLELRKELQAREQLIASIGFPVQMTRLLQTLDSVMPREMSLTEFNCQIEEQLRAAPPVAGARGAADKQTQMDRRLNVKLAGVTPSEMDLANFLAGLTDVPFFDQVAVSYARSKVDDKHVMREFEITFSMSLNRQVSGS